MPLKVKIMLSGVIWAEKRSLKRSMLFLGLIDDLVGVKNNTCHVIRPRWTHHEINSFSNIFIATFEHC